MEHNPPAGTKKQPFFLGSQLGRPTSSTPHVPWDRASAPQWRKLQYAVEEFNFLLVSIFSEKVGMKAAKKIMTLIRQQLLEEYMSKWSDQLIFSIDRSVLVNLI
jgi:hypothetical protein